MSLINLPNDHKYNKKQIITVCNMHAYNLTIYIYYLSKVMSNQSLMFFEEITKWVDDGSPVDVVYLYFQKTFDKVPHQRLTLNLKAHGIGNDVINWIEKWLTHRRQRVIVNWKSVLSGVPQGSVL